ncbi:MAG: diguanylate cyclase, partial [Acidobacteriota bacterium]
FTGVFCWLWAPMKDLLDREQVIEKKIRGLMVRGAASHPSFRSRVEALDRLYGPEVYPVLLYALSHLEFDSAKAKKHWAAIWEYRQEMRQKLGRNVDFRVAMLSYFLDISHKIRNPKIIEITIFHKTENGIYIDPLTGLHNYRFFQMTLEREVQRVKRYGTPLSLVVFDIDYFKQFNDRYGHLAGNRALVLVARALVSSVRDTDTVVRYGGEEFVAILPETTKTGALRVAERARRRVETGLVKISGGRSGVVTVSGGVAQFEVDGRTSEELIKKADRALYISKSRGKNMVTPYVVDRREFARVEASIVGRVAIRPGEQLLFHARNASENGLLFYTDRALAISSLVELNLTLPRRRRGLRCRAQVARIREVQGSKEFEVGVRIVEMPAGDKRLFHRYLDQALAEPKGSPAKHRKKARRPAAR